MFNICRTRTKPDPVASVHPEPTPAQPGSNASVHGFACELGLGVEAMKMEDDGPQSGEEAKPLGADADIAGCCNSTIPRS